MIVESQQVPMLAVCRNWHFAARTKCGEERQHDEIQEPHLQALAVRQSGAEWCLIRVVIGLQWLASECRLRTVLSLVSACRPAVR